MTAALETREVVAGYVPDLPIVRGVSVHVAAGEVVTVIGPNGAGKSTLLKAIAGLVPVSAGSVRLRERDITRLRSRCLHGQNSPVGGLLKAIGVQVCWVSNILRSQCAQGVH